MRNTKMSASKKINALFLFHFCLGKYSNSLDIL